MTDNMLRIKGMNALVYKLGALDAERFICMVRRDDFDYEEWQRGLWKGKIIEDISVR